MALKRSSSTISIGASVTESGANTFTQTEIDLQLNPLDNEVFVVQAVNLDLQAPDGIAATNTQERGSLSSTSLTSFGTLTNSNVLAVARDDIRAAGFADGGVGFSSAAGETVPATLDYIGIISTNNFFLQVVGTGNAGAKNMAARVYGYRAKADAATYAALVQSEVLSA